jgi:hypothetical protein
MNRISFRFIEQEIMDTTILGKAMTFKVILRFSAIRWVDSIQISFLDHSLNDNHYFSTSSRVQNQIESWCVIAEALSNIDVKQMSISQPLSCPPFLSQQQLIIGANRSIENNLFFKWMNISRSAFVSQSPLVGWCDLQLHPIIWNRWWLQLFQSDIDQLSVEDDRSVESHVYWLEDQSKTDPGGLLWYEETKQIIKIALFRWQFQHQIFQ